MGWIRTRKNWNFSMLDGRQRQGVMEENFEGIRGSNRAVVLKMMTIVMSCTKSNISLQIIIECGIALRLQLLIAVMCCFSFQKVQYQLPYLIQWPSRLELHSQASCAKYSSSPLHETVFRNTQTPSFNFFNENCSQFHNNKNTTK